MIVRQRAYASVLIGVGLTLLATACGDDAAEGPRQTVEEVQATSYVVKEPVTTPPPTTAPTVVSNPAGGEINPLEQIHVIEAGDSVYGIASKYGITPEVLVNYNGWTDGIGHFLVVGEEVRIPPNSQVPGTGTSGSTDTSSDDDNDTPSTNTTEAPEGVGCQHTVVANDNPTRVAKQYDVTVDELAAANAGNPAYQSFLLGSQLNIPANGSC